MSEQMLIENSEEGSCFVQLNRTEATTFYDSRYGAAVKIKFTKKYYDDSGNECRKAFEVVLKKNEWTEFKRAVNEILKGK